MRTAFNALAASEEPIPITLFLISIVLSLLRSPERGTSEVLGQLPRPARPRLAGLTPNFITNDYEAMVDYLRVCLKSGHIIPIHRSGG